MKNVKEVEIGGKSFSLETGRFAKQADGAVMARFGDTMVLAAVAMRRPPLRTAPSSRRNNSVGIGVRERVGGETLDLPRRFHCSIAAAGAIEIAPPLGDLPGLPTELIDRCSKDRLHGGPDHRARAVGDDQRREENQCEEEEDELGPELRPQDPAFSIEDEAHEVSREDARQPQCQHRDREGQGRQHHSVRGEFRPLVREPVEEQVSSDDRDEKRHGGADPRNGAASVSHGSALHGCSLHTYNQTRSTEAVNRLAVLSLIFGSAAVVTGFFGMNFGGVFSQVFFEPMPEFVLVHRFAIITVALMALGAVAFGVYLIATNPADYREILIPMQEKSRRLRWFSLKKTLD